jgi:AcrR family transcriptional regulator
MTDERTTRQNAGASRRRGAVLEEAILQAAVDELTEFGFAGLTMDRVAQRAGTNKNAIYRRWPDKLALGIAAYQQMTAAVAPPDTGNLRDDALEYLRRANRHWSSPLGMVLRDLLSAAGGAAGLLGKLPEQSPDTMTTSWQIMLERAIRRGEASPKSLHPRVATVAIVLLRNEFVIRGIPTAPDEVVVEIVDEVFLPLVYAPR